MTFPLLPDYLGEGFASSPSDTLPSKAGRVSLPFLSFQIDCVGEEPGYAVRLARESGSSRTTTSTTPPTPGAPLTGFYPSPAPASWCRVESVPLSPPKSRLDWLTGQEALPLSSSGVSQQRQGVPLPLPDSRQEGHTGQETVPLSSAGCLGAARRKTPSRRPSPGRTGPQVRRPCPSSSGCLGAARRKTPSRRPSPGRTGPQVRRPCPCLPPSSRSRLQALHFRRPSLAWMDSQLRSPCPFLPSLSRCRPGFRLHGLAGKVDRPGLPSVPWAALGR